MKKLVACWRPVSAEAGPFHGGKAGRTAHMPMEALQSGHTLQKIPEKMLYEFTDITLKIDLQLICFKDEISLKMGFCFGKSTLPLPPPTDTRGSPARCVAWVMPPLPAS